MRFSGASSDAPRSFNRRFVPSDPRALAPFEPIYIRSVSKAKKGRQADPADGFAPTFPGHPLHPETCPQQIGLASTKTSKPLESSLESNRSSPTLCPSPVTWGHRLLCHKAIERGMKNRKNPAICETIELWQQNFFVPRGLDVSILQNGERLTARSPNAPIPSSDYPFQRAGSSSAQAALPHQAQVRAAAVAIPRMPKMVDGRQLSRKERKQIRKQRRAERKHEKKMAKIEKKHKRNQRKYPGMADLPPRSDTQMSVSTTYRRSQRQDTLALEEGTCWSSLRSRLTTATILPAALLFRSSPHGVFPVHIPAHNTFALPRYLIV